MHTTFSQLSQHRPPFLVEQHLRQSDQPLTAKLVVQKVEARREGAKRGHPWRPRGSLVSRVDKMFVVKVYCIDLTVNFHHEHFIDPTNCPWVSEDERGGQDDGFRRFFL